MSERKHALLSPSSSHIWLHCPPSARLSETMPDQESDFARQGTCAHSLCQYKLERALGLETEDPRGSLEFYDEEMEKCSDDYASFVLATLARIKETCQDPVVLIEQNLDFSPWVPEGYGFGDCIIISDGVIHVIDYKHGEGVLVEAENNPQMMCYALGAINLLDGLYDIEDVSMTIFQPRRQNVSTWAIKKSEILTWAENTLKPIANLAFKGEGQFCAGEHCRFCKVKNTCSAHDEYTIELAKQEFATTDDADKPLEESTLVPGSDRSPAKRSSKN